MIDRLLLLLVAQTGLRSPAAEEPQVQAEEDVKRGGRRDLDEGGGGNGNYKTKRRKARRGKGDMRVKGSKREKLGKEGCEEDEMKDKKVKIKG